MVNDVAKVTDPEARRFWESFLASREINKEYFTRVPEDKFDFRMVDRAERKSDSPRESLVHQIDVTRDYINGIKTGVLKFRDKYDDLADFRNMSKKELMEKFEESEKELVEILSDPDISNKKVKVPWSKEPITAVACLWGLDSHEVLHTGWNLALMDFLGIERFQALKRMWG